MKQDARTLQTKKRLKESLLDLLRTRPFYEISVVELCRVSGIGRTAFYRHYGNLSRVLDELLDEMLSQLPGVAAQLVSPEREGCALPLCEFVRREPRYLALFRNESLTDVLLDKLTAVHREDFVRTMLRRSPWSERQLDTRLRFQTSGCITLILALLSGVEVLLSGRQGERILCGGLHGTLLSHGLGSDICAQDAQHDHGDGKTPGGFLYEVGGFTHTHNLVGRCEVGGKSASF